MELVPPERIVHRPGPPFWDRWTWSVYDPASQGEYYGGEEWSRERADDASRGKQLELTAKMHAIRDRKA